MIIDGRTIRRDSLIECEVCVVGAGPAGLAAAAEFLDQDMRVCLLESGDSDRDAATELLSDCTVEENEDLYPSARYARDRRIGGTSAQWDVMIQGVPHIHVTPLEPIDFSARPWLPHSGWPIDQRTLGPFYARAQSVCGAGPFDYLPESWSDAANLPFSTEEGRLVSKMLATSPQAAFQRTLPRRIAASDSVRLLTWSNAVELQTDENANAVRSIRVVCLDGNRYRVAARTVILAQGGFEVPRLLLASNGVTKSGLGNGHDLVGRFLMDRQIVKTGRLVPRGPEGLGHFGFYDMRRIRGRNVQGKLILSPETLEREQILGTLVSFSPTSQALLPELARRPFGRGTTFRSPAYASARAVLAAARQHRLPPRILHHLGRIVGGLEVHQMCEQSPDPDNRITLGDLRDATGMPVPHIRFRWNEADIRSVLRSQEILKEDIERAGLGELRLDRRGGLPLLAQISAHHPAGTTRMASQSTRGVVDADCRVHGVGNLFIASSSVFPTGGHAPPTLTIVALAIRVSDKVKKQLTSPDEIHEALTH